MKTQKLKKSKRLIKKKRISTFKIMLMLIVFSFSFLIFFRNGKVMQNILNAIKRGFRADQSYSGKDLNIGDTVYYDHKTPKDRSNDSKLTVTLNKGSASEVGTGVDGTQTISSKNTTTKWTVWDNKDGEVVLISDVVPAGKRYGAIGYIWQEHILNLIASTYGYGKGANIDKVFAYEVGSGAKDINDTSTWNTGANGIPKSGARAFNTSDIEAKIQTSGKKLGRYEYVERPRYGGHGYEYGENTRFPQRDTPTTGRPSSSGSGNHGSGSYRPGSSYEHQAIWNNKNLAIGSSTLVNLGKGRFICEKNLITDQKYKKLIFENLNTNMYTLNDRQMTFSRSRRGSQNSDSEKNANFLSGYVSIQNGINSGLNDKFNLYNYNEVTRTYTKKPGGGEIMSVGSEKASSSNKKNDDQTIMGPGGRPPDPGIPIPGQPGEKVTETTGTNNLYFSQEGIRVLVYLKKNLNYTKANNQNNVWNIDREGIVPAEEMNDPSGIKTGDIVYYNHKDAENINNKSKQSVTIKKGTSKEPGYGIKLKDVYKWNKYNTIKKSGGYYLDPPDRDSGPGGGSYSSQSLNSDKNKLMPSQRRPGTSRTGYGGYTFDSATGKVTLTNLKEISYGSIFYTYNSRGKAIEKYSAGMGSGHGSRSQDRLLSTHRILEKIYYVKDSYIGVVESEIKNTYPVNGEQKYNNSSETVYWYEYMGVYKVESNIAQSVNSSENTTWRVFDKTSNGGLVLISNKPVAKLTTGGNVGHIWWEHNAHKMASIFGYGLGVNTNATSGFKYKVGSGIENAPDMTTGDKGNWNIGSESVDKINVSGARALTFDDVQDKLGVYGTNIAIGNSGIKNNKNQGNGGPYYDYTTSTSMSYVPQRNIDNSNQSWNDAIKGKLNNRSYVMKDRNFWWNKTDIPTSKYKDMLFNQVNGNTALATNAIDVRNSGRIARFSRVYFSSKSLGTNDNYFVETTGSTLNEFEREVTIRPLVYLDPNVKLIPAKGESNAWDLRYDTNKNLKFNVTNKMAKNADLKVEIKPVGTTEANLKTDNIFVNANSNTSKTYTQTVKKGYTRSGKGDSATFSPLNNKYAVNITGLPAGVGYTVNGKENAELNLDKSLEYNIVIYDKYNLNIKDLNVRKGAKVDINDSIANLPSGSTVSLKSGSLDTTNVGQKNITIKIIVDGKEYEETIKLNVLDNIKVLTTYINRITNDPVTNIEPHYIKEGASPTVLSSPKEDAKSRYEEILKEYGKYNIKFMVTTEGTGHLYTKPSGYLDTKQYSVEYVGNPNKDEYIVLKNDGVEVPESKKYLYKNGEKVLGDTVDVEVKLIKKMPLPFTGSKALIKNTAFVMGMCILVGTVFRFRRKIILIFKKYNLMK